MRVAETLKREVTRTVGGDEYDCHAPAKAEAVAENLLQNWRIAKLLVEAHGGKFIGILQPVAYLGRTPPPLGDVVLPPRYEPAYRSVYLIRQRLVRDAALHDLVSVLDGSEGHYLDWCHFASDGNRLIAEQIAYLTAPLR